MFASVVNLILAYLGDFVFICCWRLIKLAIFNDFLTKKIHAACDNAVKLFQTKLKLGGKHSVNASEPKTIVQHS